MKVKGWDQDLGFGPRVKGQGQGLGVRVGVRVGVSVRVRVCVRGFPRLYINTLGVIFWFVPLIKYQKINKKVTNYFLGKPFPGKTFFVENIFFRTK